MPSCYVPNCKNSSAKGYLMQHFPRKSEIWAQWALNISRPNWMGIPTNYSCICEMHFSPDMWEKSRVDGKRILKHHAIPTIFEMGDTSNLVSNEISISKEPIEPSVIDIIENELNPFENESKPFENELNPSSSRLNCEEKNINRTKILIIFDMLQELHELQLKSIQDHVISI